MRVCVVRMELQESHDVLEIAVLETRKGSRTKQYKKNCYDAEIAYHKFSGASVSVLKKI